MNKVLNVMVGIPASGKTSYAKFRSEKDGAVYVSRDEIRRNKINEGEEHYSKETEVFNEFIEKIQSALDSYKTVFADATHLSEGSRRKLLRNLNLKDVKVVAIYIDTPYNICFDRNSKRGSRERVPEEVMESMRYGLSQPKEVEGFDEVIVIKGGR